MTFRNDPDGRRLPVKLDTTSTASTRRSRSSPCITRPARSRWRRPPPTRGGWGSRRREFLVSACGAATTLLGMNAAYARAGRTGGWFDVPEAGRPRPEAARARRGGRGVHLRRAGALRESDGRVAQAPARGREAAARLHDRPALRAPPGTGRARLPALRRARAVREGRVPGLGHRPDGAVLRAVHAPRASPSRSRRRRPPPASSSSSRARTGCYIHGRVNPNQPGDLERMDLLAGQHKVAAWKTYTQWGPDQKGFWMDDEPASR